MPGDPTMRPDVDIMGVQRGAHKDGADVCPQYIFKVPGGVQPDGTPLCGWRNVHECTLQVSIHIHIHMHIRSHSLALIV